jgi:hypothetical protein
VNANPYKFYDVFQAGALPKAFYVDKSKRPEYQNIRYSLLAGGNIVHIYGPTKVGKTSFCMTLLRELRPILVSGNISSLNDFWSRIASELHVATVLTGSSGQVGQTINITTDLPPNFHPGNIRVRGFDTRCNGW